MMIKIKARNKHASVENVFEDDQYDRAFQYYSMLEEHGTWDDVEWICLPNLTLEKFTEGTINDILNQMKPIKITEEE